MRKTLVLSAAVTALLLPNCSTSQKVPLPKLDRALKSELVTWLDANALPPEEYVISKFRNHDIVFLGENHRIRHDPVLVQNLIPLLYRAGVRNLGIEFATAASQREIDSLLTGPVYDPGLAGKIFWDAWPWWGYQEYIDILRAAWRLNSTLPGDSPRFRVVGLNARMYWRHMWSQEDRNDPEIRKMIFPDGPSDQVMAETIRREILAHGEKALVYCGHNHAYTRYQQPNYDVEQGVLKGLTSDRTGNLIYKEIGDRAFLIILHSPWPSATGYDDPEVYPADGVIDAVFAGLPPEKRRAGFDVINSPFGRLPAATSYWSHATDDFRLDMYCDGWIYQKPLSQYEGVTVVPGWFNEGNRLQAIEQLANPDPRVKNRDRTVESLTEALASDTDLTRRFARFH